MKIIPSYHPPSDYRRPTKTQEKVYVPVNDYPEINFSMLANPLILPSHARKQAMRTMFMAIKSHSPALLTLLTHITAHCTIRAMTNT